MTTTATASSGGTAAGGLQQKNEDGLPLEPRIAGYSPDGGVIVEFGAAAMPSPLAAGASVLGFTSDGRAIVSYPVSAVASTTVGGGPLRACGCAGLAPDNGTSIIHNNDGRGNRSRGSGLDGSADVDLEKAGTTSSLQ